MIKIYDFCEKTFVKCSLVLPNDATPQNFTNSHKSLKFTKVFSLKSFLLYGIMHMYAHAHCVLVFRDSLGSITGGILDYSVGFQSLAAVRFIIYAVLIMSSY